MKKKEFFKKKESNFIKGEYITWLMLLVTSNYGMQTTDYLNCNNLQV